MQEAGGTEDPCKRFCDPVLGVSEFWGMPTLGTPFAFADGACNLQSAWSGSGGVPDWPGLRASLPDLFPCPPAGWRSLVVPGKMASSPLSCLQDRRHSEACREYWVPPLPRNLGAGRLFKSWIYSPLACLPSIVDLGFLLPRHHMILFSVLGIRWKF